MTSQSSKMREEFEAALITRGHFADTLESLRTNDGYAWPLDLSWAMFEAGWLARGKQEGWISVGDRLPEHMQSVLVYREGRAPQMQQAKYFSTHSKGAGFYCGDEVTEVAYWSALPAAPTETGKR